MLERWTAVVAATLGLFAGMGGAFIGGNVANKGQQQLFREQRATRLEDARRATYVAYLRELENHFFLGGTPEKARALQAAVLLVSHARRARRGDPRRGCGELERSRPLHASARRLHRSSAARADDRAVAPSQPRARRRIVPAGTVR